MVACAAVDYPQAHSNSSASASHEFTPPRSARRTHSLCEMLQMCIKSIISLRMGCLMPAAAGRSAKFAECVSYLFGCICSAANRFNGRMCVVCLRTRHASMHRRTHTAEQSKYAVAEPQIADGEEEAHRCVHINEQEQLTRLWCAG